jgi:outer membrane protein OmpA-like peptidoglycan-associated protein
MKKISVSIPEPCHANWAEMTPTERGRHCSLCDKVVVDFSKKSKKEFEKTMTELYETRTDVCGRLDNSQLTPTPAQALFEFDYQKRKLSAFQMFVLSFVFAFFLGGFSSCKIGGTTGGSIVVYQGGDSAAARKHVDNFDDLCENEVNATGGTIVINYHDSIVPKKDSAIVKTIDGKISFDFGSTSLNEGTKKTLDLLATQLKNSSTYSVELIGHTDNRGSEKVNKRISLERATSVKEYLEAQGIKVAICRGVGYQFPIADNNTKEGRAQNRRVEIKVTKK